VLLPLFLESSPDKLPGIGREKTHNNTGKNHHHRFKEANGQADEILQEEWIGGGDLLQIGGGKDGGGKVLHSHKNAGHSGKPPVKNKSGHDDDEEVKIGGRTGDISCGA
jgi:hypothetical protein